MDAKAQSPDAHETADVVEQELKAWAARLLGGEIARFEPVTGGNRRRGALVEAVLPDGTRAAGFLRYAVGLPEESADPYTLRREAQVYAALQGRGIAIARLLGVHDTHEAMLIEVIAGHPLYAALDRPAKAAVASQLARALAVLHAASLPERPGSLLAMPATRAEAVANELAIWRAMYAETCRDEPVIAFALRWLERHAPTSPAPPVLVHGDAGPGNFLIDGGGMTALIDWELSHFGDPVEDLAWTSFRAAIQPVPDFRAFVAEYAAIAGTPIDRDLLRYHRVFVATRILIVRHRDHGEFEAESDPGNSLISLTLNRRAVLSEIAAAEGWALPDVARLEPSSGPTRMQDFAIKTLKDVIAPRSTDPLVLARSKSLVRVVKYLRQEALLGEALRAASRADVEQLLGPGATDAALARTIDAGGRPETELHALLWRRVEREGQVAAPSLGVLAGQGYPEF